jgi:hypothetical protein
MAGRGMGAATKGGGCVSSGARNKMTSKPSTKVAVMMKDGGMAKKAKKKDKDVSMPMATGIGMAMRAGKSLAGKAKNVIVDKKRKEFSEMKNDNKGRKKKPVKKMGGGMMKKYKKGGYAGSK